MATSGYIGGLTAVIGLSVLAPVTKRDTKSFCLQKAKCVAIFIQQGAAENQMIKQLCLFQPNRISMFRVHRQRGLPALRLWPGFCTVTAPGRPRGGGGRFSVARASVVLPVDQKATRAPRPSSRLYLSQMNTVTLQKVSRLLVFPQSGLQQRRSFPCGRWPKEEAAGDGPQEGPGTRRGAHRLSVHVHRR